MPLGLSLALVPLLIFANAFFVSAEYAVISVRPAQIAELRRRGRKRTAAAIERQKTDRTSAIGAIQVCITMTNLMLGSIGEPAMSRLLLLASGPLAEVLPPAVFRGISTALSYIVVTLLTVVLSELLPKALTLRYGMFAATLTAIPTLFIQAAVRPLVWIMNHIANAVTRPLGLGRVDEMDDEPVTVEELRLLATRAAESGALNPREQSLVLNSLALAHRTARDVMVHRTKVAYLDLRKSMDENRTVMNAHLYSRLPLCDGGFDRLIGLVPTKEFLTAFAAEGDTSVLRLIAMPPVFVPETVTADRLMTTFREHKTQMLIVANEHGGVEGIVTLNDVLDELLYDSVAPQTADGITFPIALPGDTPAHEVGLRAGLARWAADIHASTLSGVLVAETGGVPAKGQVLDVDGLSIRVDDCDSRVVKTASVLGLSTSALPA